MGSPLDETARQWFSIGLGLSFILSLAFLAGLAFKREADVGYVGLLFTLIIIFFVIAFSFLVAASAADWHTKAAIAVVDALVLLGSKLFAPSFLDYIADTGKPDYVPLSQRKAR